MKRIYMGIICLLFVQAVFAQANEIETADVKTITTGYTRPPAFEDMDIYRIKVKLTTGVGRSANTDDDVYIQFNDKDGRFYLKKCSDNFHTEGRTATYDILSENVKKVKDIQYIRLGIKGDDGFCMKKIQLFLNSNSSPIYENEYGNSGKCMDNHSSDLKPTYEISKEVLRKHPNWGYTPQHASMWAPPEKIAKSWIVALVEGAIGNQITADEGIEWGNTSGINTLWGAGVEVAWVNSHTIHVDLDLQQSVTGPNPEMDVDFDLDFSCSNGRIMTQVKNVTINTNWVGKVEKWVAEKAGSLVSEGIGYIVGGLIGGPGGATLASAAGGYVGGKLSKMLSFELKLDIKNPSLSQSCKQIVVTKDCDILLK